MVKSLPAVAPAAICRPGVGALMNLAAYEHHMHIMMKGTAFVQEDQLLQTGSTALLTATHAYTYLAGCAATMPAKNMARHTKTVCSAEQDLHDMASAQHCLRRKYTHRDDTSHAKQYYITCVRCLPSIAQSDVSTTGCACVQVRLCPGRSPVRQHDLDANADVGHDCSPCRARKARLRYALPMKLCMDYPRSQSCQQCT